MIVKNVSTLGSLAKGTYSARRSTDELIVALTSPGIAVQPDGELIGGCADDRFPHGRLLTRYAFGGLVTVALAGWLTPGSPWENANSYEEALYSSGRAYSDVGARGIMHTVCWARDNAKVVLEFLLDNLRTMFHSSDVRVLHDRITLLLRKEWPTNYESMAAHLITSALYDGFGITCEHFEGPHQPDAVVSNLSQSFVLNRELLQQRGVQVLEFDDAGLRVTGTTLMPDRSSAGMFYLVAQAINMASAYLMCDSTMLII